MDSLEIVVLMEMVEVEEDLVDVAVITLVEAVDTEAMAAMANGVLLDVELEVEEDLEVEEEVTVVEVVAMV